MRYPANEFEKVFLKDSSTFYYWTWKDWAFLPYTWIDETELKNVPLPFYLYEIHPDCPVGFESDALDEVTNIIELPKTFEELKLDSDLRKDLKRIDKKNLETEIIFNEPNVLDKSKQWFLELWLEDEKDFQRRMHLWKKEAYTLSAYHGTRLMGVHIAIEGKETIYYLGCWWNREFKSMAIPTFLLKKDIEIALQNGKKFYDLGIGDEPYKKQWGVKEKPTKYYAIMPKEIAEKLEVEHFTEMKWENRTP